MKKTKTRQKTHTAKLCHGRGQYHTDRPDAKNPENYTTILWSKIMKMVKSPGAVPKEMAPWVIFSTLISRTHKEQREHGEFYALWADLDENKLPLTELVQKVEAALGCTVIGYLTRSATKENLKARILLPLFLPIPGADFVLFQKILNDKLEAMDIKPDRTNERAGQLCYLPNKGEHYDYVILDTHQALDPYNTYGAELAEAQKAEQAHLDRLKQLREEAKRKAQARVSAGELSPIDAYNAENDIELALESWGAKRLGNKWLSPNSSSKAPGIKRVPDANKAHSHHQSDADAGLGMPVPGGGVIFDPFDLYCLTHHGNDRAASVAEIGRMLRGNTNTGTDYSSHFTNNDGETDIDDKDTDDGTSTTATAGISYSDIKRPSYITWVKGFTDDKGRKRRPGLYRHFMAKPKKQNEEPYPVDLHICTPIRAIATTSDGNGSAWGLLLEVMDPDGRWSEIAFPMESLKGSGEDLRGTLLDMGLRLDPKMRSEFATWLTLQFPKNRIIAASSTGWHNDMKAFVLPDRVFGSQNIRFQSSYHGHNGFGTGGTFENWQKNVAAPCRGNPMAILSLSASLAGVLIHIAQLKAYGGAGLHLVGDTSKGKTTLEQLAASAWGDASFVRTWRATSNGLEAVAASLNDTLLILDEISECDPREIGNIIYCLSNGVGKTRAKRTGGARDSFRWRIFTLSSGERSVSGHMSESPGRRPKAGQEVRLLDIPATKRKHGCFDELHGYADGRAFCDSLKGAVSRDYGHAGPMFIGRLLADTRDMPTILHEIMSESEFSRGSSIEGRAGATMALVAMAGELAIEYEIFPWEPSDAIDAAVIALESWRAFRGVGKSEAQQILDDVREFCFRHGDTRFSRLNVDNAEMTSAVPIRDRAGFLKDYPSGKAYLMHPSALREACPGMDMPRILDALTDAGWIIDQARQQRSKTFKISGEVIRLYVIQPTDDSGVEEEL